MNTVSLSDCCILTQFTDIIVACQEIAVSVGRKYLTVIMHFTQYVILLIIFERKYVTHIDISISSAVPRKETLALMPNSSGTLKNDIRGV